KGHVEQEIRSRSSPPRSLVQIQRVWFSKGLQGERPFSHGLPGQAGFRRRRTKDRGREGPRPDARTKNQEQRTRDLCCCYAATKDALFPHFEFRQHLRQTLIRFRVELAQLVTDRRSHSRGAPFGRVDHAEVVG